MGAEMATVTGDCLAIVSARAAGHGSMREDEWVEMAIGSSLRGSRDCGNRDAHCWLSRPWTSGLVGWATSTREFCGTREYAGGGLRGRPNASPQGHARPPARVDRDLPPAGHGFAKRAE